MSLDAHRPPRSTGLKPRRRASCCTAALESEQSPQISTWRVEVVEEFIIMCSYSMFHVEGRLHSCAPTTKHLVPGVLHLLWLQRGRCDLQPIWPHLCLQLTCLLPSWAPACSAHAETTLKPFTTLLLGKSSASLSAFDRSLLFSLVALLTSTSTFPASCSLSPTRVS